MNAFWNTVFSLFFVALVAYTLVWLSGQGLLVVDIPVFHLALLSLATFRLVRLFSYDHITGFVRTWLGRYPEGTFLGTGGRLLGCPWCTGMWFAFLVYVGYATIPQVVLPIALILSIAAMGSLLQLFANLLGWSAEAKKQKAQDRKEPGSCG